MIRSIEIRNFRCYRHLHIENCSRLNVIVGDNGSGKTALLESIFLPLVTTTDIAIRYRQQRGLDGNFHGSVRRIEEAIFGGLFNDLGQPIQITLSGDGPEARSLVIARGTPELQLDLEKKDAVTSSGIRFIWKDAAGNESSPMIPKITPDGRASFPETGEDIDKFFFFGANQPTSSGENATRFSDLSKAGRIDEFVKLLCKEYDWIDNINIEVSAGAPILFASLRGVQESIPLANVSGGINRIVGIMLAIAARPKSVVLVDEIENGIYHEHQAALWHSLLASIRKYDVQLFVTTHSIEWIKALFNTAGKDCEDIALWRLERSEIGEPVLYQFSGKQAAAAVKSGEIR